MMLAILLSMSLGQTNVGVKLYDESTYLGPVTRLKCVGSGIVCSLYETGSTLGVITVTGGGGGGVPDSIPAITFEATPDLSAERVLSNGQNTTIDQGTTGQVKVNLSGTVPQSLGGTGAGGLTCSAGQALTSNGTAYSCSTQNYSGLGTCGAGTYAMRTNANAAPTCAQVAFTELSGTVTDAQLASSYSGVGTCTNQFARVLNDNAGPTCASVGIADHSASGTPSSTTFLRGDNTWATPAGGSGNAIEVEVDFGSSGSDTTSLVVTGQTWVTSTSKITCAAALLATADRVEGAEDAVIEGLRVAFHSRVAGTGFTVVAAPQFGRAVGKFKVHCTGG